jgi:uncharacterized protein YjbI with pentapeptide repeats
MVLSGIDCSGWDFSNLRLGGSTFVSVELNRADFREADLRDVRFDACDYDGTDFSGADLRGAFFSGKSSEGARFSNADIRQASIGTLTQQQLHSTESYRTGDLSGIKFRGTQTEGMDFSCQVLTGAVFDNCDFTEVDLSDAVISEVEFRCVVDRHRPTPEQLKSTWNYEHSRMDSILSYMWDPARREYVRDERWPGSVLRDE